jgi:hypothetical protein
MFPFAFYLSDPFFALSLKQFLCGMSLIPELVNNGGNFPISFLYCIISELSLELLHLLFLLC